MRTAVLGIIALGALVLAPSQALAQQDLYGSVQIGIADYSFTDSNGIISIATLGLPLPQLGEHLAFEGEATRTLSRPQDDGPGGVSYTTFGGYGVHALPIGKQLDLRARVGVTYERVERPGETANTKFSGSAGLGLAYELRNGLRVVVDHTLIGTDIANTSIGLQMRF